ITALMKEKMFDKTEELMKCAKEMKIQIDATTFHSLISEYGNQSELTKMLEKFEQMKKFRIKPTTYTYNLLIKGFCKSNNIDAAMAIFETMKISHSKRTRPDGWTYNTLISALYRTQQYEEARKLLKEMEEY